MDKKFSPHFRGVCRHCGEQVQLVHQGGQTMGNLVIGPHHAPVTRESAITGKVNNCPGAGQLPVETKKAAAQK